MGAGEGALLFRGMPVESPLEFREFADALGWDRVKYEPFAGQRWVGWGGVGCGGVGWGGVGWGGEVGGADV